MVFLATGCKSHLQEMVVAQPATPSAQPIAAPVTTTPVIGANNAPNGTVINATAQPNTGTTVVNLATPVQQVTSSQPVTSSDPCNYTVGFKLNAACSAYVPDFGKGGPNGESDNIVIMNHDDGRNYVYYQGRFYYITSPSQATNYHLELGKRIPFSGFDINAIFGRFPMAGNLPNSVNDLGKSGTGVEDSNDYQDALVGDNGTSPKNIYIMFDKQIHFIDNQSTGEAHGIPVTKLSYSLFLSHTQIEFIKANYGGSSLMNTSQKFREY